MARRFPKTAELWESAESLISEYPLAPLSLGGKCNIIAIVLLIIAMSTLQSIFGTIGTAVVANPSNETATVFEAIHEFLHKYRWVLWMEITEFLQKFREINVSLSMFQNGITWICILNYG